MITYYNKVYNSHYAFNNGPLITSLFELMYLDATKSNYSRKKQKEKPTSFEGCEDIAHEGSYTWVAFTGDWSQVTVYDIKGQLVYSYKTPNLALAYSLLKQRECYWFGEKRSGECYKYYFKANDKRIIEIALPIGGYKSDDITKIIEYAEIKTYELLKV